MVGTKQWLAKEAAQLSLLSLLVAEYPADQRSRLKSMQAKKGAGVEACKNSQAVVQ